MKNISGTYWKLCSKAWVDIVVPLMHRQTRPQTLERRRRESVYDFDCQEDHRCITFSNMSGNLSTSRLNAAIEYVSYSQAPQNFSQNREFTSAVATSGAVLAQVLKWIEIKKVQVNDIIQRALTRRAMRTFGLAVLSRPGGYLFRSLI